jgi:hypothetical protein
MRGWLEKPYNPSYPPLPTDRQALVKGGRIVSLL